MLFDEFHDLGSQGAPKNAIRGQEPGDVAVLELGNDSAKLVPATQCSCRDRRVEEPGESCHFPKSERCSDCVTELTMYRRLLVIWTSSDRWERGHVFIRLAVCNA